MQLSCSLDIFIFLWERRRGRETKKENERNYRYVNKYLNKLAVEVNMRTFVGELGGGMTGSLALHTHMHADRECMSRSIHAHTHCLCIPDIIYGAGERVGESTAPHIHTHRYPTGIFTGGGMSWGYFYHALCKSFFPSWGEYLKWEEQ